MDNAQLITWACKALMTSNEKRDYDCTVISSLEVAATDYSTVIYLQTTYGAFYIKKGPEPFLIEIDVLHFIREIGGLITVPQIVAQDKKQGLLITKACGAKTIRKIVTEKDFGGVCDGSQELRYELLYERIKTPLNDYRDIQEMSQDHIDDLLKMNIADWRLENFSTVFAVFLEDTACMKRWALPVSLIQALQRNIVQLERLCKTLNDRNPRVSLSHCDFHDNNIIYNSKTKETTLIDWSEVVITHPLLSRISCLENLKKTHNFDENHDCYKKLKTLILSDVKDDKIYEIAERIALIYYVLCLYQLYRVTNADYGARAISALEQFIKTADIKDGR